MAKLGTKDIKTGGGTLPTIQPGNVVCKINSLTFEDFKLKEGAINIILNLETHPIAGFDGLLVDKDKPEGPRFKGQVGRVKASNFAFSDGTTTGGTEIDRDQEILKFMKNLCVALGRLKWLDDQDGKHDTIDQLLNQFEKDKVYRVPVVENKKVVRMDDIYLEYCICAKEYIKGTFTNFDLFLPKWSKDGSPFGPVMETGSKVVKYNPENTKHLIKAKIKPVEEFGGAGAELATDTLPIDAQPLPGGDVNKDFEL